MLHIIFNCHSVFCSTHIWLLDLTQDFSSPKTFSTEIEQEKAKIMEWIFGFTKKEKKKKHIIRETFVVSSSTCRSYWSDVQCQHRSRLKYLSFFLFFYFFLCVFSFQICASASMLTLLSFNILNELCLFLLSECFYHQWFDGRICFPILIE